LTAPIARPRPGQDTHARLSVQYLTLRAPGSFAQRPQQQVNVPSTPVLADQMYKRCQSFDEIRIDRHSGGKIAESWFMPDRLTVWAQLGLLPPRGTPTR